jgi:hypothetical protein
VQQEAIIVYAVATKYGVPIVNYSGAFSNAQTGYAGTVNGSGGTALGFGGSFFVPSTGSDGDSQYAPTAAGYAIMTMMAQTAFATVNAQPKSLYLQGTMGTDRPYSRYLIHEFRSSCVIAIGTRQAPRREKTFYLSRSFRPEVSPKFPTSVSSRSFTSS